MSVTVNPGRPVNLVEGSRTYVAKLNVDPDFARASLIPNRTARKAVAAQALRSAEQAVARTLVPQLDAMKGAGQITSYELIPYTGAAVINVPDSKAGAAYQALNGLDELGRILRNREIALDDPKPAPGQPTPPPPAPPAVNLAYNVDKVNANDLWAAGVTGKGVTVGIVDTGLESTHEAIRDHYRGTNPDGTQTHDYNFSDFVGGRKEAYDDHAHGTHVAGTVAGGTATQLIGMAPDAKVMSTKVFTARGSSTTETILKGLGWMVAPTDSAGQNPDPTKAPDIVSNSWGGAPKNDAYQNVWSAFAAAGIIPVVSAGNSGPRPATIKSPGAYAGSITVGATDINDVIARFSSRGPSAYTGPDGKPLPKPDVSAPGVDVYSAGLKNSYRKMSGTSMSAPGVSGVIALLLSKHPTMTTEQVRTVLQSSAVDLGTPGPDMDYGHGRVDAVAALAAADRLMAGAPAPAPAK